MRIVTRTFVGLLAVASLVACSSIGPARPVAGIHPTDLAGQWSADLPEGGEAALDCRPDGTFSRLVAAPDSLPCREVGYFWVEDGRLVMKFRTNDCEARLAGHTVAYPILQRGEHGFVIETSAGPVTYTQREP